MITNSHKDFKKKNRSFNAKRFICIIISAVLLIGIMTAFCIIREHKLRRAILTFENLTFDGMEFVPCTNYALTSSLEPSKVICKTIDGEWRIKAVEGYEENLEYVYARLTFDGRFYERVK